jgi:hypothetical protein
VNKEQITFNRYLIMGGVVLSVLLTVFILYVLRGSGLSLLVQRTLAWIPVIPIFMLVDRYMHRPENFIPMSPYVEYGMFVAISILFIIGPTLEQRAPWMGPLLSLMWLIPLGYVYYHKRNKYE